MEDHHRIQATVSRLLYTITQDVDYFDLKPHIVHLFSRPTISRAEGRNKSSFEIMDNICSQTKSFCKEEFFQFVSGIAHVNPNVAAEMQSVFQDEGGGVIPLNVPVQNSTEGHVMTELLENPEDVSVGHIPSQVPVQCAYDQENAAHGASGTSVSDDTPGSVGSGFQSPDVFPASPGSESSNDSFMLPNPPNSLSAGNSSSVYFREYSSNESGVYRMDSLPRGSCLIINNQEFDHLSPRRGSDKDMENLEKFFSAFLGFEVKCKKNQTVKQMRTLLKKHAQNASSNHCVLAVVILSHGGRNDHIFGKDGKLNEEYAPISGTYMDRAELMQYFTSVRCKAMRGKPKLFIIQACRGTFDDKPNAANTLQQDSSQARGFHVENDGDPDVLESDDAAGSATADTHTLFSSSPGYASYRYPQTGSVFVGKYIEYVKRFADRMRYDDIIKEIEHEICMSYPNRMSAVSDVYAALAMRKHFNDNDISSSKIKTMPEDSSTLLKNLYLNPVS